MTVINWRIRELLPHVTEGQLKLLLALLSRCNARNRCWPTTQQLATDTGLHHDTIVGHRRMLVISGAIELVPCSKRVAEEKKLPPRQFVYQMTGIMNVNGVDVPYLYLPGQEQVADNAAPQSAGKGGSLTMSKMQDDPAFQSAGQSALQNTDDPAFQSAGQSGSSGSACIEVVTVSTQVNATDTEIQKEKAAAESSTHARTRASAREAAAAAGGPVSQALETAGVEKTVPAPTAQQGRAAPHPLVEAWAAAHAERGLPCAITADLAKIAESYAAMGVQADDVRSLTADKLAGGRKEYSFRFILQDLNAWRNSRFRAQMQRPDGAPPVRRYEAEAWEAEPALPAPVPRPFDARWKTTFEKAWMQLNLQALRESSGDWRHLQKAQLMDADSARFVLAFESPVGVSVATKWARNIERALLDAGGGAVPREVTMEAITMDEWRARLAQMQPATAAAAAAAG